MTNGVLRQYSVKAGITPSMQGTNPSPSRAENEFPLMEAPPSKPAREGG
jgi:hypothetical protein